VIYFAGDFHLGVPDGNKSREREKQICDWLNFISADASEIYLMGDIFDFWFEYKQAVPKGYVRLLGTLAFLTDKGIKISTFKGNHDMWMFGYLPEETGLHIISDSLEITRNNKKFFLHHGDGLGKGEPGYRLLRSVFRSRLCQWLFARLHPNFGIGLALYLSRKSRISQKNRYENYLGDDKEILTQFCIEKLKTEKIDYFIFGHRHLSLEILLPGNAKYINTGEWVHGSSYAKFDGENLHLLKWQP